jgi:hypothetical protein
VVLALARWLLPDLQASIYVTLIEQKTKPKFALSNHFIIASLNMDFLNLSSTHYLHTNQISAQFANALFLIANLPSPV